MTKQEQKQKLLKQACENVLHVLRYNPSCIRSHIGELQKVIKSLQIDPTIL
ncbi:MAG: hypothetical protein P9M03_06865 [Candidatus Theseobacter exili]|nr:hypothetical protein [Candidatus Theseobacter exili]